ncbi:hypothetical protein, partial [Ruegeria arenilitoris]|uniref:hypothetical protein n=1 Tax=Ruegeria arenilitoris TaxID=1173585 RepID=UPI001C2C3C38
DSYFVRNWSGMDIKDIYDSSDDFNSGGPTNQNILIKNSEFIDQDTTSIIVTTLDRTSNQVLNENNATDWVAQNIRLENSVVENTDSGSTDRVFLVKSGYDVHWSGVKLLGKVSLAKTSNTGFYAPEDVNGTGVTKGSARPSKSDSYYKNLAGPDWSDISYPTDGSAAPDDPVVDPDPISYTPPSEPAPVVEAPELVNPQETNASILLDIFVAYTDTDETISEIGAGSSIDSSLTDGSSLGMYAMSKGSGLEIGRVEHTLDGISKVGSIEPDALFGDNRSEDFFGGKLFAERNDAAELVVCKGENDSGGVLGTVSFNFALESVESDKFLTDVSLNTLSSFSTRQGTKTATVSKDQSTVKLEDSACKSRDLGGKITEGTILIFDFKSGACGNIQGIGLVKETGQRSDWKKVFFHLDGPQPWGIQDYSNTYETGSGSKFYAIPVGEYYMGPTDQIVLVNDDNSGLGSMSTVSNIYLIDAIS